MIRLFIEKNQKNLFHKHLKSGLKNKLGRYKRNKKIGNFRKTYRKSRGNEEFNASFHYVDSVNRERIDIFGIIKEK